MKELLSLSAARLAEMIRNREISSLEVVEEHIDRAKEVNPIINAIVKDRFSEARAEAEKADKQLKKNDNELPPLFGVPCTIKECFALKGMPNASGLLARKDVVSQSDAPTVARYRAAGAIPLGVTNTSELCMWMETNNRVYGRTNNPYDPGHIVGGSSGGEGAIIASGASPFGLGSDVGGSIRMPAFFNGVFGHKPTGGLIPNTGQYPTAADDAMRYLTTGPLARKAQDLWPLIRILKGPDGQDPGCADFQLGDPSEVDISKLRVVVVNDNGQIKVADDLKSAINTAAKVLEREGAAVETRQVKGLRKSLDIWSGMLYKANGATYNESLGNGRRINIPYQLLLWAFRRSPHTLPAIILAAIEGFPGMNMDKLEKIIDAGNQLREELVELIGPDGVMLYPPYSRVAPRHYKPMFIPFHYVYTGIINVMELPVTQVPLGLNDQGLPLGVQVIGVHGNDHLTVAVAQELEKAMGGWVPPSTI